MILSRRSQVLQHISSTPTIKLAKLRAAAAHWPILSPIPPGCNVTLARCDCPIQHCECEVDLELSGPDDAWRDDPDFVDRMAAFLLAVDPTNYAMRDIDPEPLRVVTTEQRIEGMADRLARGYVATSPHDLDVSRLKIGEAVERGRNGSSHSMGLKEIPA